MRVFSTLTMATLVALAAIAPALATPPPGTMLGGTIEESINTSNAYVGEPVQIDNVSSPGARISGATMSGRVTRVVRAGQGRPAQLGITLTTLTLASGERYAIDGVVTAMATTSKPNTLKEVAGAVGGMVVGNILGKVIFHTGVGGLLGAAGGYLLARNNRQNISLPNGAGVTVKLLSSRRQARP